MKLLIIYDVVSDVPHYRRNHLARMFDEIRYVACLHPGPAPAGALYYDSDRVKLIPLPPSGGKTLGAKLNIQRLTPFYLKTIYHELSWAGRGARRCPNNIGLLTMMLLNGVSLPQKSAL